MAESVERLLSPVAAPAPAPAPAAEDAAPPALTTEGGETFQFSDMHNELVVSANRKLTLRCGKSSITLHPDGRIVLRGEYILSDAESVNRIQGGRIELN